MTLIIILAQAYYVQQGDPETVWTLPMSYFIYTSHLKKLFSEVNCPELREHSLNMLCKVPLGLIGHFPGWAVDPTDWWLSKVRSDNCRLDTLSSLVKHWCSLCCCLASEGLLIFHAVNGNMYMISCFFFFFCPRVNSKVRMKMVFCQHMV